MVCLTVWKETRVGRVFKEDAVKLEIDDGEFQVARITMINNEQCNIPVINFGYPLTKGVAPVEVHFSWEELERLIADLKKILRDKPKEHA